MRSNRSLVVSKNVNALPLSNKASAIALYTLLVGATASVVRAAIMAGLSLFAAPVGRRPDGLNTLAYRVRRNDA